MFVVMTIGGAFALLFGVWFLLGVIDWLDHLTSKPLSPEEIQRRNARAYERIRKELEAERRAGAPKGR